MRAVLWVVVAATLVASCNKKQDVASPEPHTNWVTGGKPIESPTPGDPDKAAFPPITYDPKLPPLPSEKTAQDRLDEDEAKIKTLEANQAEFCRTAKDPPPNCFGLDAPSLR